MASLLRSESPPFAPDVHESAFERVLGTTFTLTVLGPSHAADEAEVRALATIDRLEAVYSRFQPDSDLVRWLDGDRAPSAELASLLDRAARWMRATGGAFHPGAETLRRVWQEAEASGLPPDPVVLAERVAALRRPPRGASWPPYAIVGGERHANLDAIAKGRIADEVAAAVRAVPDVEGVLADLGGDLRISSRVPLAVAVPDPTDAADNAPADAIVHIAEGAIATSGVRVRGFRIGGHWYPHLLDPRGGRPVRTVAGATVVAPSCADADALATAFCVMDPGTSVRLADRLPGIACRIRTRDGSVVVNEAFVRRTHPETVTGSSRPDWSRHDHA